MSDHGKKVGKFSTSTVLGKYDLDVRLDMEDNQFVILVPRTPGEAVNTKLGRGVNYDSFRAATLADAKKSVESFLAGRELFDLSRKPSPVGDNEVFVHSVPGNDIVTFSLKRNGRFVDPKIVEARADDRKIYLRTGCFCNPGVNETVFGYSVEDFASFYNDAPSNEQLTLERFQRHLGGRPIGAIRASFGYANAPGDVDRIVEFMKDMITCKDLPG